MSYFLHLLIFFSVYAILAMTLNVILGFAGMFSLAHAAFFAIGAYGYAILSIRFGWGFIPAILATVGISMAASLLISLPSWRLSGDYLLMVTMAAQALVYSAIYNWYQFGAKLGTWQNLTNGPYGIMEVPGPRFFGVEAASLPGVAATAFGCLLVIAVLLRILVVSPWGRLLEALRDDELVTRNLGKRTRLAKVQALALGCGVASVAGAVYASYVSYVDPSICTTDQSVLVLAMVLVGGLASFWGPLVGASLMVGLPELLRFLHLPQLVAANLRVLVFGALLVLMVHLRPQGLLGRYRVD
jgi:branched-chain amino acid transport system permease protein